jgi:hypothetical protein
MISDEMTELSELLPIPPAGDLSAERARVLREHMLTEFRLTRQTTPATPARHRDGGHRARRHQARHRLRRPLLVSIAGVGALGIAAICAVALGLGAGAPRGGASPAAATLLAKIASAAERQPSPRVHDGDFMYIRSEIAFASYTNGSQKATMDKLHERQVWLPVANICNGGLLIENDARTSLAPDQAAPGFIGCGEGTLNGPTYRLLQSLPTDPRTLLNLIYKDTQGEGQSIGPDGEAFTTIGDLIREAIVPPKTAAALYRAAALIPGVTLVGQVKNAVGRPGIAVAYTEQDERQEWIFDPATLQFIGERDYDMTTGAVSGDTAILRQAFVPKAGQLPSPDNSAGAPGTARVS